MRFPPLLRNISFQAPLLAITILFAFLAGTALPQYPWMTVPAAFVGLFLFLASLGRNLETVFLFSVLVLLFGYLFMGKGFAYIGLSPLYVGELVLGLGILALLFAKVQWRFSRLQVILLLFMALGFLRTIPYLDSEGIDAARDAALWYYGAFAILLSLFLTEDHVNKFLRVYASILGVLLVWVLFCALAMPFLADVLPHFPGSPVPVVHLKAGDRSVILAGLAAFKVVGLQSNMVKRRLPTALFWLVWMAAAIVVAVESRAAFLALLSTMALLAVLRPSREWMKAIVLAIVALCVLIVVDPNIDVGRGRAISVNQLVANVTSVFSEGEDVPTNLQGTKDWRLTLWSDIYESTVTGPKFMMGDGFGTNIPAEYGYSLDSGANSVRSPHSTHLAVLARMGVPGALLWIGVQLGFFVSMMRAISRTRDKSYTSVLIWLLAIWMAAIVNTSFETALEGPHGAIPFWCTYGAGIATMRLSKARNASPEKGRQVGEKDSYAFPARP
jgi:hypothetical protein